MTLAEPAALPPVHLRPLAERRAVLQVEGVEKRFGSHVAVDRVDLEVKEAELFSLLGPSGCGKSTLLRMIAGFELPDSGRILIDGQDVTRLPPYARPVNMMFQSYALFPHMSVLGNVAYGLRRAGLRGPAVEERALEALRMVRMDDRAKARPAQLSGGQRQRVALARALVNRPKLLLLDEPMAALDRKLREQTQFELVNLQEKLGIAFVTVTHDQDEAMVMSSRIAVMRAGRIAQLGTPTQLYENPTSRYVADFLGRINLLDGTVEAVAGEAVRVAVPKLGVSLEAVAPLPVTVGQAVSLALRPEKVTVEKAEGEAPAEAGNALAGTVQEIAYLGDISSLYVQMGEGVVLQAVMTNTVRRAAMPITWGDRVRLRFDAAAVLALAEDGDARV